MDTIATYKAPPISRVSLNLRAHKGQIAFGWALMILSSAIVPLIGYFVLRYATTLKVLYILAIFTLIFGAVSLFNFAMRTYRLARPSSTCRPLGSTSAWTLDYFDYNFAFGFVVLSVVISIGIALKPSSVRMVSMPLSILMLLVCGQLVLFTPARAFGMRAPFRVSSCAKGELIRPAAYTIAEDVVAVDGKQGDVFRGQWNARYESSPEFRRLLAQLDVMWGLSGVLVAAVINAVIWGFKSTDAAAWAVGWSVPWIWAGLMTIVTIQMTKAMCKEEDTKARESVCDI